MQIKILGSGCANCHTLEARTREALSELGLAADVSAITDYPSVVGYGVMNTPALVVDERVVLSGRVPSTAQLAQVLRAALPQH